MVQYDLYEEGITMKQTYSYLIHFNSNHDPKTGRFTFNTKDNSMRSKIKNYNKTINSLSDEEYRLFTDGANRNEEKNFIKNYMKWQKDNPDASVFISKYGNVTMASLDNNEWNIGWATNPKNRGTGITQANIKEAIGFVRQYSDLPISAIIEQQNIASQKTAEKAGFKDAGYTKMEDGSIRKRYVYE